MSNSTILRLEGVGMSPVITTGWSCSSAHSLHKIACCWSRPNLSSSTMRDTISQTRYMCSAIVCSRATRTMCHRRTWPVRISSRRPNFAICVPSAIPPEHLAPERLGHHADAQECLQSGPGSRRGALGAVHLAQVVCLLVHRIIDHGRVLDRSISAGAQLHGFLLLFSLGLTFHVLERAHFGDNPCTLTVGAHLVDGGLPKVDLVHVRQIEQHDHYVCILTRAARIANEFTNLLIQLEESGLRGPILECRVRPRDDLRGQFLDRCACHGM